MTDSLDDFYREYHVNLIGLFGVIVIVYISIFSLFNSISLNTPEARPWIAMIEILLWILFVVILFLNMKHFSKFEFDFNNVLYNLFGSSKPELEIHVHKPKINTPILKVDVSSVVLPEKINPGCAQDISGEVFHIPRNRYTYDQAVETCKLFDARLATYEEVEDSYKNGANWCSYGWSSDQLALFPIQKSLYNELKKIPGHERDCGRIGVNGGYIKNKDTKFGINCYGKKPYAGEDDLEYMNKYKFSPAYPDVEAKKKEREKLMNSILIAPFNKTKWNEV
jgi:hypothetical protein